MKDYAEMSTKVASDNIYTRCLVPFFSSCEAEQYGESRNKIEEVVTI